MVRPPQIRKRLDTIEWYESTGSPAYDSDGNPIIQEPELKTLSKCRYENFMESGNRGYYRNRNGEDVLATGVIYISYGYKVPERFSIVSLVKQRGPNTVIINVECLSVDPNQLNTTIYVTENVGN